MIGALAIGAGMSALGSIFGASKAKKEEKKKQEQLNRMLKENEEQYLENYYSNSLDSPTSKAYLKRITEQTSDRDAAIDNSAISSGATEENKLAKKQANNEVMSGAINNVVINEEQQQARAKESYLSRKTALQGGQLDAYSQKAQNWSTLGNNLGSSIGGLTSAYLGSGKTPFSGQGKNFGKPMESPLVNAGFEYSVT